MQMFENRSSDVEGLPVRRALPLRKRRTVGAWCFADIMGPATVTDDFGLGVGPHPHTGLHTVTWLFDGEEIHNDSLGSEQAIRPGQLNLMTAGRGIAHSEDSQAYRGNLSGIQLWVAQPESTRFGDSAFLHVPEVPQVELDNGEASLLIGDWGSTSSPATLDSELFGAELNLLPGRHTIELNERYEYAVIPIDQALAINGEPIAANSIAVLEPGESSVDLEVRDRGRTMLLGGPPFGEQILMWWNFVARTPEEVIQAVDDWNEPQDDRYGEVSSRLARISAPQWEF